MTIQERINCGWISESYKTAWREGSVDEFINNFPIFKNMFEQITCLSTGGKNTKIAILKSTGESKLYLLLLFTEKHEYFIAVKDKWICGAYSNRYYEPLEDWTRGRDLCDGDCTEETLNKILLRIIGTELVRYDDGSEVPKRIEEQGIEIGSPLSKILI